MPFLMALSIGPVQDFIASARRSRDLWFGSWLLSELAKAAALVIVSQHKKESLIFPYVDDPSELTDPEFNAPNKLLALVENPNALGANVAVAIKKRLSEIAYGTDTATGAFQRVKGAFDKDIAQAQIAEMTELFWVAVPYEENANSQDTDIYRQTRRKVEYLLAARKATRDFQPVTWGTNAPKSSLDGQRESVIPKEAFKKSEYRLWREYGIREKERLCGVGLLKRHGQRGPESRFFSTSHIAALPFLATLTDKKAVSEFVDALRDLGIASDSLNTTPRQHPTFDYHDGHLLFSERMHDYFDDAESIAQAQAALKTFLEKACDGKSPTPYYALLLADGDAMGQAIDAQSTPAAHRKISQALSEFARGVKPIVDDKYNGSLIYAGGDDVLALVPLHTVLDCAKDLAENFHTKLEKFAYEKDKSPTLSVGVAVAHHLEPLSDALELARRAEKDAKGVKDKNALAVIVDKRSGTSRTVKDNWGKVDVRLRQLIEFDRDAEVSRQTAYELRDLQRRLEVSGEGANLTPADRVSLAAIKRDETARILKRKLSTEMSRKEFDKTKFRFMLDLLEKDDGLAQLANELIVAKVFADAHNQAEGR